MPLCKLCKKKFPSKLKIDGKIRNLHNRKYCLECSPFGCGNTKKLEIQHIPLTTEEKRKRDNEKYKKWQRKARKNRKIELVKMCGGACSECGYNRCMKALEFHHKNMDEKQEKSFGFSSKGMLARWDKLIEEVKKCVLVCSNCHREIHDGMR
ncbi:MAG: HNH endonuclease [Proteobacteria bacterium]|jgi:hypothetical protein|nr:HNH endonuclease [Pseudomonadota bacterium]